MLHLGNALDAFAETARERILEFQPCAGQVERIHRRRPRYDPSRFDLGTDETQVRRKRRLQSKHAPRQADRRRKGRTVTLGQPIEERDAAARRKIEHEHGIE